MKHFDLHCHPALKTFLGSDTEAKREDCWEEVDVTGIWEIVDKLIGDIIDSQASLAQLEKGNFQIAVAALYSIEHPLITGKIGNVINLLEISRFLEELSHDLLAKISENKPGYGYHDILNALKQHLINSEDITPGFNFLNKIGDLQENTLNIIFAIEGGHALFNNPKNYTEQEIFHNLDQLKNGAHRFLYLTLTHLADFPFANQCYGMKLIEHPDFKPKGNGITDLGNQVIKKSLDDTSGDRILIDVKHMSLKSRLQYYQGMKTGEYPNVPIIVSHAGVTGVSYKKMPIYEIHADDKYVAVEYTKPEGLMGTEFNPWSINLYDEEIPFIIETGGLIGVIMEERILGCGKVDTEYFSRAEFEDYQSNILPNVNKYRAIYQEQINQGNDDMDEFTLLGNQLRHLCNNILHIVKVGGKDAWKHICFGTDYDGMVNAVNFCKTAAKFKRVQRKLVRALPLMAKTDPDTNYHIENIEQKVEDILYNNAIRFLNEHFK